MTTEKTDAFAQKFAEAMAEQDGEKLAVLKMVGAFGLVKHSKLPAAQLSDFAGAAVIAYRSAVQLALVTDLMKTADKMHMPLDAVLAMKGLVLFDADQKNQKRLATLCAMFDAEQAERAAAKGEG